MNSEGQRLNNNGSYNRELRLLQNGEFKCICHSKHLPCEASQFIMETRHYSTESRSKE